MWVPDTIWHSVTMISTMNVSWQNWCVTLLGFVIVIVAVDMDQQPSVVTTTTVQNCSDTQKRCMTQLGCSVAIHNYLIHCSPLIQGETDQCTYHCKMALLSLLSTESHAGQNINTCDCQGNEFCVLQRSRLQVCQKEVMSSIDEMTDPKTPLTCSLAIMMCSADTSCFTALNYYYQHCRKLIKGEKCTSKCNNSLSILYRQPKASKLRNCICDGMESGGDCLTLKNNTETLCFGNRKQRQRHRHHHHSNHTKCRHHHHGHHHKDSNHDNDECIETTSGSDDRENTVDTSINSPLTSSGIDSPPLTSQTGAANQNTLVSTMLLVSCVILTTSDLHWSFSTL